MFVVIDRLKSSCDRDSYDINKAAKDIATKTLKKSAENSKKQ